MLPVNHAQLTLEKDGCCLEVMTGSILPMNTDLVIRYEDLEIANGQATVQVTGLWAQAYSLLLRSKIAASVDVTHRGGRHTIGNAQGSVGVRGAN